MVMFKTIGSESDTSPYTVTLTNGSVKKTSPDFGLISTYLLSEAANRVSIRWCSYMDGI